MGWCMTTQKLSSANGRAAAHIHLTCTACAKAVQVQSIANPSMGRVVHTLPPLGEEHLAIDRFCEDSFLKEYNLW